MATLSYHEQKDIENIKKLRELQKELPSFCSDFFRGIETSTSTRTRIAYAYDLKIFFQFLKTANPGTFDNPSHTLTPSDLEKLTVTDLEEYIDYLKCHPSDTNEDVINTRYGYKTKLYYPHGNIVLCVDSNGEEQKIRCSEGNTLLQEILNIWESTTQLYPLFICEGSSNEKVKGIYKNYYLTYVYKKILPNLPNNIICYGWSLSENDEHILKQILSASISKKIYISIHKGAKDDTELEAECATIKKRIIKINLGG